MSNVATAISNGKDLGAFGGYEKSEEDHRNLHVIAKYFHILAKRVYLSDFGSTFNCSLSITIKETMFADKI